MTPLSGLANPVQVLVLARYGPLGASSRLRFFQFFDALRSSDPPLLVTRQSLLDDDYLQRKYRRRRHLMAVFRGYWRRLMALRQDPAGSIWWVEKELWPWMPAFVERLFLRHRPYVLDLDDAIFHNYDLHPSRLIRLLLARKIDSLMQGAVLVTAGNEYLASRARSAGARRVEILPTVVDLGRYAPLGSRPAPSRPAVIVWVGSPSTVHYLRLVVNALARLGAERLVEFHVIGAEFSAPGLTVRCIPWSEENEARAIGECDIGIMPLTDSPWERGKCGYKLLQYMACGLPVVASPVGVNTHIVKSGENGFLALTDDQWVIALRQLVDDPALRSRLGQAGRKRVEREFCLQVTAPRIASWFRSLSARDSPI